VRAVAHGAWPDEVDVLYAETIAIGPFASTFCVARSAAFTAASMPGLWLPLMTADVGVSRSTVGFALFAAGAIRVGLNILIKPWLFPQTSAAVIISAWMDASSAHIQQTTQHSSTMAKQTGKISKRAAVSPQQCTQH
jgi:hypothetical protein